MEHNYYDFRCCWVVKFGKLTNILILIQKLLGMAVHSWKWFCSVIQLMIWFPYESLHTCTPILTSSFVITCSAQLPDSSPSPVPHDGSPVLGKAVLTPGTGYTSMDTPPVSLKPEYIKGTSNLSPLGKMQVRIHFHLTLKCSTLSLMHTVLWYTIGL